MYLELTGDDFNHPEVVETIQRIMNEEQDAWNNAVEQFAKENEVSEKCASDVLYLRTRSRWTPELESNLIRLHKEGTPPNIFEYP